MENIKKVSWNHEKNLKLKQERGLSFEEMEVAILNGRVLEVIEHPNTEIYSHRKMYIIDWKSYAVIVPYVETETDIYLITAFHSRKATKKYFGPKGES